jgi:hypothetical protein
MQEEITGEGREFFNTIDTNQDHFEITFPNGSKIKFYKD